MNKGTSLYLDLVRFAAAMTVFMGHIALRGLSGGQFWRLALEGDTAVAIFFVLSGYVIAYVMETRERDAIRYTEKRISRLYSVLLPALLLCAVCDGIGFALAPRLYRHLGGMPWSAAPAHYLVAALLLNRSWLFNWGHGYAPGTLTPIWSLSLEASYYVAAGIVVFCRGSRRIALLCLLGLVMGPIAILLAPLWGMGYALYRFQDRLRPSRAILCAGMAVAGLLLCVMAFKLGSVRTPFAFSLVEPIYTPQSRHYEIGRMAARYAAGIGFAINLIGMDGLAALFQRSLSRWQRPIRFAGMLTYPLYLFHRPIVFLLVALSPFAVTSTGHLLWVFLGALALVIPLGLLAERMRPLYGAAFDALLRKPARRLA